MPGNFSKFKKERNHMIRKFTALFSFFAFAVVGQATTVLNQSDAGTPAFTPDYTMSFSSMATFPCNQTPLSGNSTPCNLPASFALTDGINNLTVSGAGLELMNNASQNGGAASPIGHNDWLIYVGPNESVTFTFASAIQGAGALVDTDQGGKPVTVNGLTYAHPGTNNFPYWLGVTDDTQSMVSLTLTAGPNSGFLLDSLNVKNADPLAPTAEATPMVLVGSGLSLLGWMKRRRRVVAPFVRPEHDITEEGSDNALF
jgi:hypothetical protein